jgi:hypothetical protein
MVMNPFFDNYIKSLSTGETRKITDVLKKAKVESDHFDKIAETLRESSFANLSFSVPELNAFSITSADEFMNSFETYDERIATLFMASNLVALLLDSYSSSLMSDIASIESELNGLEKAIGNYAFLLSDAKAHDYAFLEPFSDLVNQDLSGSHLSDRDKSTFTPEQMVALDGQEGCISISNSMRSTYSLKAQVVKTNYQPHVRSDSGVQNSALVNDKKGWRVSIASPTPIKSSIALFDDLYPVPPSKYVGPLAVVDYTLDSPATCDTIKITPFSEFEQEITQIILYHGLEGQEERHMLDGPVLVDSPINLYFPMTSVSKFRVFLRQPLYTRLLPNANRKEEDKAREGIAEVIVSNQDREAAIAVLLNDLIGKIKAIHGTNSDFIRVSDIPLSKVRLTDVASFEKFLMDIRYQKPSVVITPEIQDKMKDPTPYLPKQPSILNAEVEKLIETMRAQLVRLGYYRLGASATQADKSLEPKTKAVNSGEVRVGGIGGEPAEPMLYAYNLGLRSVVIGSGSQGFKAVYVSNILDAPSDLTDVKIKVSDFNYKVVNRNNESQPVTSVEYSVTNNSNPKSESAWLPILPADEDEVLGERLLLDSIGKAKLRFPASFDAPLTVLKNNEPLRLNPTTDYITNGQQHITGLVIPAHMSSGTDIFTCNYVPAHDVSVVNFESAGGVSPSLASAYSSDGVGESISNAFGQLSVILNRVPYVDKAKVEASTLNPILGLTGYQPVTIRFADGSTAYNFTDYVNGANLDLDPGSEDYQFVHNGNAIQFNKPLIQGFRVYYKYIPCNVRFRAVLRCNHQTFISPKVDYVHLKAKTRSVV